MTFLGVTANFVMRAAMFVAPGKHIDWMRAMSGELSAIDKPVEAIKWSLGGLGAAVEWRIRQDAVYALGLVSVPIAIHHVFGVIGQKISTYVLSGSLLPNVVDPFAYSDGAAMWLAIMLTAQHVGMAIIALTLCLHRPGRTVFTGIAVWLMAPMSIVFVGDMALPLLANPFEWEGNHPSIPNIMFFLSGAGGTMWSSILGALAARAVQRRNWRVIGVYVLAFVVGAIPAFQFFLSFEGKPFSPLAFDLSLPLAYATSIFVIVGGMLSLRNALLRKLHEAQSLN